MLEQWIEAFKSQGIWVEGTAKGAVDRITSDSRSLFQPGEASERIVFFARRGAAKDGHEFLKDLASKSSIVAFVVERIPKDFATKVPVIVVRDSTWAMALATKFLYQNPTSDSFCVAVTGTNGKTTTTFLVEALLKEAGKRPARIGTIETHFENYRVASELTTPDFTSLQKTFSELKRRGANALVFEASSHALDQRRLLGIELDAALFTNLTPEHLDYHKTMETYYQAKKKLFSEVLAESPKPRKIAITPLDGAYGSRLKNELKASSVYTWSLSEKASNENLSIISWKTDLSGSELEVEGVGLSRSTFRSRLIGKYNIENLAGVITLGAAMGLGADKIRRALDTHASVLGRLEKVDVPSVGAIFVDYAHTPDALENVLMTLRPLTSGRLRVVFGCGGDRDRTKRPKMGAIAELHADEIFVTSDNPRTEDPESIIDEIVQGMQRIKPVVIEVDRRKAIEKSLQGLKKNDVVLIAGKGHENYQILGTTKVPFDDREVVQTAYHQGKGERACSTI